MFVPDKAVADTQLKIKVKAFSMSGISDAERTKLQEDIDQAKKEAMEYASLLRGSSRPSPGRRVRSHLKAIADEVRDSLAKLKLVRPAATEVTEMTASRSAQSSEGLLRPEGAVVRLVKVWTRSTIFATRTKTGRSGLDHRGEDQVNERGFRWQTAVRGPIATLEGTSTSRCRGAI